MDTKILKTLTSLESLDELLAEPEKSKKRKTIEEMLVERYGEPCEQVENELVREDHDELSFLSPEERERHEKLQEFYNSFKGRVPKVERKRYTDPERGGRIPCTPYRLRECIRRYDGQLDAVADHFKLPLSIIERVVAEDPESADLKKECERRLVRFAENMLQEKIANGDAKAIMFYLERKGGYEKPTAAKQTNNTLNVDFNMLIQRAELEIEAVAEKMLGNQKMIADSKAKPDDIEMTEEIEDVFSALDELKDPNILGLADAGAQEKIQASLSNIRLDEI